MNLESISDYMYNLVPNLQTKLHLKLWLNQHPITKCFLKKIFIFSKLFPKHGKMCKKTILSIS